MHRRLASVPCSIAVLPCCIAVLHSWLAPLPYCIGPHSAVLTPHQPHLPSFLSLALSLYSSHPSPNLHQNKNADDKISRDGRGVGSAAHTLTPPLLRRGHTNDAGLARARDACNQHTDSSTLHSILGARFRCSVTPAAGGDTSISPRLERVHVQ